VLPAEAWCDGGEYRICDWFEGGIALPASAAKPVRDPHSQGRGYTIVGSGRGTSGREDEYTKAGVRGSGEGRAATICGGRNVDGYADIATGATDGGKAAARHRSSGLADDGRESVPLYMIEEILQRAHDTVPIANHDNNRHRFNGSFLLQKYLWTVMELMSGLAPRCREVQRQASVGLRHETRASATTCPGERVVCMNCSSSDAHLSN